VATTAKYQLQINPLVIKVDLLELPEDLQSDFNSLIKPSLQVNPATGEPFDCHKLKGDLQGHHALEIFYGGEAYRLVYRIYEKPAPKRVKILSFGLHDPAYEKAKQRKG